LVIDDFMQNMPDMKIIYGDIEQPLCPGAQYLLMQADLRNGTYQSPEFIERIERVSLDLITRKAVRSGVEAEKLFLTTMANQAPTVTIKGFDPSNVCIEDFVTTTYQQIFKELYGTG